jgi:hypothetical protein
MIAIYQCPTCGHRTAHPLGEWAFVACCENCFQFMVVGDRPDVAQRLPTSDEKARIKKEIADGEWEQARPAHEQYCKRYWG